MLTCSVLVYSYYDGNQDKLFSEAHIVSPFKKDWNVHKVRAFRILFGVSQLFAHSL